MLYITSSIAKSVSSNSIAGAISENLLRDLRVNNFTFEGVPVVNVGRLMDDTFKISFSLIEKPECSTDILLSKKDAFKAARAFKAQKPLRIETRYTPEFFKLVQDAVVELEHLAQDK